MKVFIIDFLKFGAFFAGWTLVFSVIGATAWIALGSARIRGILGGQ